MEHLLYVPICSQELAISLGASYKRKSFSKEIKGYFFIEEELDENKTKQLSSLYGIESYEAKQQEKKLLSKWKTTIASKCNFDCLKMAKDYGLPKDEQVMESLFIKLRDRSKGDYPVSWEHLREYLPSFDDEFGIERYLDLHRIHNLQGDMEDAIKNSNMSSLDKNFLYFVYEIDNRKAADKEEDKEEE